MATRYRAVHEECGFLGKPTTQAMADRALRVHSCERHQPRRPTPTAGDTCGLSIDLPADVPAPAVEDWIVTRAGSRYLITASRPVRPCAPRPLVRHELGCVRLAKHCPVPEDVRAIGLRWYRRRKAAAHAVPAGAAGSQNQKSL